jgi:hypothetical protein
MRKLYYISYYFQSPFQLGGDGTLFPPIPVYVPNAGRGGDLDENDIAMIQKQRELGTSIFRVYRLVRDIVLYSIGEQQRWQT